MSWRLDIREDALTDIETAADWYEGQQPGLGQNFARTIRQAINSLAANPLIHRLRDRRRNVRWFLPTRFPYRICYRVRDDLITVFAVIRQRGMIGIGKRAYERRASRVEGLPLYVLRIICPRRHEDWFCSN